MATASLSFSQSIQTSLILLKQQQLQGQLASQSDGRHSGWQTGGGYFTHKSDRVLGVGRLILLTVISFVAGLPLEFDAVYGILGMQYFGLPVSLVSMPGLVSGFVSVLTLPFLGKYLDNGPNPLNRKLVAQAVAISFYMTGYTALVIASLKKITEQTSIRHDKNSAYLHDGRTEDDLILTQSNYTTNNSTTLQVLPESPTSSIPFEAVLSMLASFCFTTGYDINSCTFRAIVLTVVPPQQADKSMALVSGMMGLAGIFAAILGIADFPTILDRWLAMDGFAVTLVLFCSFFIVTSIVFSMLSFITVIRTHRQTQQCTSDKHPLLHDQKNERIYGAAFPCSSTGKIICDDDKKTHISKSYVDDDASLSLSSLFTKYNAYKIDKSDVSETVHEAKTHGNDNLVSNSQSDSENTSLLLSGDKPIFIKRSLSVSHVYGVPENTIDPKKTSAEVVEKRQVLSPWNIRFALCILVTFLSMAATSASTVYQANTFTIEILKGDPSAPPGSPGRQRYDEGVKTSSIGLLMAFCAFVVFGATTPTLIRKIGTLHLQIVCSVQYVIVLALYCTTADLRLYYVSMVSYGVEKYAAFTLTLILAKENISKVPPGTKTSKDAEEALQEDPFGQMTSAIGVAISLGYLLISSFMGPLMDATGSAWPPTYVCMSLSGASIVTSIVLKYL